MPLSKWLNKCIEGSGPWLPVCSPVISTRTAWRNYGRSWADVWLLPAYRAHQVHQDPEEVEDTPRATQLHEPAHPLWNHKQGRPLNSQGKTLWQDDLDNGNDISNWGAGVDQGSAKVHHQNAKGNPHHHPLAPQGLILQVSDCVSICKTLSYRPGPGSPGVGCGKVEPPPWLKKTPRSRSNSTSVKSWAVNLHCPQVWGRSHQADIPLLPLLQQGLLIHCGLTVKKAPQWSSTPTRGARPKVQSSVAQSWLRPEGPDQMSHPCRWINAEILKTPTYPGGKPWCLVARVQCSLASYTRASMNTKPFTWLIGRQWHSGYPRPNRKQQDGGPLHSQSPGFALETTCLPLLPLTSR